MISLVFIFYLFKFGIDYGVLFSAFISFFFFLKVFFNEDGYKDGYKIVGYGKLVGKVEYNHDASSILNSYPVLDLSTALYNPFFLRLYFYVHAPQKSGCSNIFPQLMIHNHENLPF